MKIKNEIIKIIFDSIDELNQQNDYEIIKDINTKLIGSESNLDSLALVNLIVIIEEAINNKYQVSISIAEEKAMSQKNSPFKDIDSLSNYLVKLLK